MSQKAKILLVEDDPGLSMVLQDYLELLGYETILATDGEQGLNKFRDSAFDLCILDVMLPKKDGFTLATEIRSLNERSPIIFLTARGHSDDRVTGFKAGCDDYITKPFSSEELALRIEAILKRCMNQTMRSRSEVFELGSCRFDASNLLLHCNGTEQKLTPKEAALLRLLCLNRNNLLPRDQALTEIWGDADYFIGRSMDVFIARLRKYLRHEPAVSITNVHGTGFKLEVKEG
ncbi:DNA-binding response regulator, OmpR family, contains REC and winged-helix (wHTH) domain [Lentimicrobium saccharophilum]|uniref:DNA-binding response regulator, OmpR family, contains REC and winged-helix (WHTH) domain n=1 Tax=Lentimicrobium saccharophilum TaxID=1678841 RepID=A0A0S7BYJ9_9BACT|nr:response regulator transcription factor [Lentimicrobium saccharophilum]GAP42388.1 DNA-binding response regulator, OmpR family, contains REC and winged-helix (wHTH) domain [Lentimicrobium saccharophilum]